ncbi:MAG TPA: hypothetical protein VMW24_09205 [Sedimentisphaerales bacterium]|nr:hypothetical protein [Sedimentisphaerales bacterium]
MALKHVRKKKAKPTAGRKKSEIDKFTDAIDVQLRLASGEKVKKGKGYARSWMQDGAEYGVEKVLMPRIGNRRLYVRSAIVVDMKQNKPPTNELKELSGMVADGKLDNQIYKAARKPKKAVAAKKK